MHNEPPNTCAAYTDSMLLKCFMSLDITNKTEDSYWLFTEVYLW